MHIVEDIITVKTTTRCWAEKGSKQYFNRSMRDPEIRVSATGNSPRITAGFQVFKTKAAHTL